MARNEINKREWDRQGRLKNHEKEQERHTQWRLDNPEKAKQVQRDALDKKIRWFQEIKSQLFCKSCNENHISCLDFHHRDPNEKDMSIADAVRKWGRKRILAEIAKCDVLCRNCHAKFHWEEKQNGTS